jgi:monoamine oxidase
MDYELRAGNLSRRQVLRAFSGTVVGGAIAGAGVFGAGVSACNSTPVVAEPDGATLSKDSRVVIVGAGIAGLACAHRLKRKGIVATVYEATKATGGRIRSDRTRFPEGMSVEVGGELIDTGHTTMLELAQEFGIELLDFQTDDATLDSTVGYFNGKLIREVDLVALFAPLVPAIEASYAELTDPDGDITYSNANGASRLDGLTIAEWFDEVKVEGDLRRLLDVAYTIEYGIDVAESNALNFLQLVGTSTEELQLFGESDERFRAKAGNQTFIEKLAEAIGPDQIAFEHKLVDLSKGTDGGYLLTFERSGSSVQARADAVIVTVPFSLLRDVNVTLALPEVKRRAIRELPYGKNAKLMVGFSSRPWRTTGRSNGEVYSDLGFQATWETSRLQPGSAGILTNYTGASVAEAAGNGTENDRAAEFLDGFDKVFPGSRAAANGTVLRAHWPSNPWIKGSYSGYLRNQWTGFRGAEAESFENVYFAGEHTSLAAQGYMEGGAESGVRAAGEVLRAMGISDTSESVDGAARVVRLRRARRALRRAAR